LSNEINRIEKIVQKLAAKGLFDIQIAISYKSIQDQLEFAKINLKFNKLSYCKANISYANHIYSQALLSASKKWRISKLDVYRILLSMIAITCVASSFYYFSQQLMTNNDYVGLLCLSFVSGAIASSVRQIIIFGYRIRNTGRVYSIPFYVIIPPTGGILAAIAYLLIHLAVAVHRSVNTEIYLMTLSIVI
jgi:hypothetical protein